MGACRTLLLAILVASPAVYYFRFVPHRHFSVDDMPTMTREGKPMVAIVTGANTGIGKVTSRELAVAGAHVVMACRSSARCDAAAAEITSTFPPGTTGKVQPMVLDLAHLDSVRAFVAKFKETGLPLHILVNNAGVMMTPKDAKTVDGYELQFGVNHMGHALLTLLLWDDLQAAQPSRVVMVSSRAHLMAPSVGINFDALRGGNDGYNAVRSYGQSKLANILFARALARRAEGTGVRCNAAHPGYVNTELQRNIGDSYHPIAQTVAEFAASVVAYSPEDGALTQLYLAASPEVEEKDIRGAYFVPIAHPEKTSALGEDTALGERLFDYTLAELNIDALKFGAQAAEPGLVPPEPTPEHTEL